MWKPQSQHCSHWHSVDNDGLKTCQWSRELWKSGHLCWCTQMLWRPNSFHVLVLQVLMWLKMPRKIPIVPKLQFFRSVAQLFDPFLRKYHTEEPVMPFLEKDLAELIKVMTFTISRMQSRKPQGNMWILWWNYIDEGTCADISAKQGAGRSFRKGWQKLWVPLSDNPIYI